MKREMARSIGTRECYGRHGLEIDGLSMTVALDFGASSTADFVEMLKRRLERME
jgi:hypothetical protein